MCSLSGVGIAVSRPSSSVSEGIHPFFFYLIKNLLSCYWRPSAQGDGDSQQSEASPASRGEYLLESLLSLEDGLSAGGLQCTTRIIQDEYSGPQWRGNIWLIRSKFVKPSHTSICRCQPECSFLSRVASMRGTRLQVRPSPLIGYRERAHPKLLVFSLIKQKRNFSLHTC